MTSCQETWVWRAPCPLSKECLCIMSNRGSRNIRLSEYRYIPNAAIHGRKHVLASQGASLGDAQFAAIGKLQVGAVCPQGLMRCFSGFACEKRQISLGSPGRINSPARWSRRSRRTEFWPNRAGKPRLSLAFFRLGGKPVNVPQVPFARKKTVFARASLRFTILRSSAQ